MKAHLLRSDAMVDGDGIERELVLDAEWFQLTYSALRVAPEGETVAVFDHDADAWFVGDDHIGFSDIVFSVEEGQ